MSDTLEERNISDELATAAPLDLSNVGAALVASILCGIVSELINGYLIYRHDDYKVLTREIIE